jgi:hypothetical protein
MRILVLLSLAVLLTGMSASPTPKAPTGDELYFSESGHSVSGEFLDYFKKADDPLLLFGYPLTEVFEQPLKQQGWRVQYFQHVRMELDPTAPAGARISLAYLGSRFYDDPTLRGTDANIDTNNWSCRYFPVTKLNVCYAFLQFYDAHDGATYFGNPISKMETMSDGRLVQYFEKARMEWWPERPVGARVILSDLGKWDFEINVGGTDKSRPQQPGPDIVQDIRLSVWAFVAKPLVKANATQTINVVVQNQFFQPVQGALVMAAIKYPDGQVVNQRLPETDINGVTTMTLPVGNYSPNQMVGVEVNVKISQGPSAIANTYFRIWW